MAVRSPNMRIRSISSRRNISSSNTGARTAENRITGIRSPWSTMDITELSTCRPRNREVSLMSILPMRFPPSMTPIQMRRQIPNCPRVMGRRSSADVGHLGILLRSSRKTGKPARYMEPMERASRAVVPKAETSVPTARRRKMTAA